MDYPNVRSSHVTPTPRGGGFAFVPLGLLMLSLGTWWMSPTHPWIYWSALVSALLLWSTGFADDLLILKARTRLIVQTLAISLFVVSCLWHPTLLDHEIPIKIAFALLCLPAGIWGINLFNFMDGTDGLAASQSIVMLVFFGITAGQYGTPEMVLTSFGLSAIMVGFLLLNLPKAALFMGDSGSTVLGFLMVVLIVLGGLNNPYLAAAALIGSSNFTVDTTLTLLKRWRVRAPLMQAHNIHMYQRLARHLKDHARLLRVWHAWTLVTQAPLVLGIIFFRVSPYIAVIICFALNGVAWQLLSRRIAE